MLTLRLVTQIDRNCAICLCLFATTCRAFSGQFTIAAFAAILLDTVAVLATTAAVLPDVGCCAAIAMSCNRPQTLYCATCRLPAASPKSGYPVISMDLLFSYVQCTSNKYRKNITKLLEICLTMCNCVTYHFFGGIGQRMCPYYSGGCPELLAP